MNYSAYLPPFVIIGKWKLELRASSQCELAGMCHRIQPWTVLGMPAPAGLKLGSFCHCQSSQQGMKEWETTIVQTLAEILYMQLWCIRLMTWSPLMILQKSFWLALKVLRLPWNLHHCGKTIGGVCVRERWMDSLISEDCCHKDGLCQWWQFSETNTFPLSCSSRPLLWESWDFQRGAYFPDICYFQNFTAAHDFIRIRQCNVRNRISALMT